MRERRKPRLALLGALLAVGCGATARSVEETSDGSLPRPAPVASAQSPAIEPRRAGAAARATAVAPVANTPSIPFIDQHRPDPPRPSSPSDEAYPELVDAGPAPEVTTVGGCRFEFLGDWVRCENAGWPHAERSSATDLAGCMQECAERSDCTAVTDYSWMGRPDLGCFVYLSTCNAPAWVPWGEEDMGREYRKGC